MDILKRKYTYTDYHGKKCEAPTEQINSLRQLEKGDHIAVERLLVVAPYWHHFIVEGVETEENIINVIEYSKSDEGFSQDYSSAPENQGMAIVRRNKYPFEDGWYKIKHKKCAPARTVVWRAKRRLGENNYHLITNNCEHFALYCKTKISSSEQVISFVENVRFPLGVGAVALVTTGRAGTFAILVVVAALVYHIAW